MMFSRKKTDDTIQKREIGLFLLFGCSVIPEALKEILPSPHLIKLFYLHVALMATIPVFYIFPNAYYLLFGGASFETSMGMLRKYGNYVIGYSKFIAFLSRRGQFNQIIKMYNESVDSEFFRDRRLWYLRQKMARTKKFLTFVSIGTVAFPLLYSCTLLRSRYATGGDMAGYPHDVESPYHFYFVVHNIITYLPLHVAFSCDAIRLFLMTLLAAQLAYLKETMAAIFEHGSVKSDGHFVLQNDSGQVIAYKRHVKRFRKLLYHWMRAQQDTIRWYQEVNSFSKIECTATYLFAALYMTIYVFLVPIYLKNQDVSQLLMSTVFALLTVLLLFYNARLTDEIAATSCNIFDDAYEKYWYTLPLDLQKNIHIIILYSKSRPLVFKFLGIIADNSHTFLEIMTLSYRLLMFLLQMQD